MEHIAEYDKVPTHNLVRKVHIRQVRRQMYVYLQLF